MPDIFTTKTGNEVSVSEHDNPIGILSSFVERPRGLHFEHQERDEEILLFVRRHFITNVPWVIITILLILTPPITLPLLSLLFPFHVAFNPLDIVLFILFYYLLVLGYAFINFLHWFYNIGIVTQKNIIDIDYTEIVNVHISATKVIQIQDVSYQQTGFFRTLFNYGDVFIQTAGNTPNFEFLRIPMPGKAVDIIHDLIGKRHV